MKTFPIKKNGTASFAANPTLIVDKANACHA